MLKTKSPPTCAAQPRACEIVALAATQHADEREEALSQQLCGGPWTIRSITQAIADIRLRTGLPDDVVLHGLRHTFATNAITNGVDVATLGATPGAFQHRHHAAVCPHSPARLTT